MNNNNYLGSSLFIIHLDFFSHPEKQTLEEKNIEALAKSVEELGPDAIKKVEKMRKKLLRRQLSTIDELVLPPIK